MPIRVELFTHEATAAKAGNLGLLIRPCQPQPEPGTSCPYHISHMGRSISRECPLGKLGAPLVGLEWWRPFESSSMCGCSDHPCNCPSDGSPIFLADMADDVLSIEELSFWRSPASLPTMLARIKLLNGGSKLKRIKELTEEEASLTGIKPRFRTNPDYCQQEIWEPKGSHINGLRWLFNNYYINWGWGWADNPWCWVAEVEDAG